MQRIRTRVAWWVGLLLSLQGLEAAAQGLRITTDGSSFGPFAIGAPIEIPLAAAGGSPPYHFYLTPGAAEIPGLRLLDQPQFPQTEPVRAAYVGISARAGVYTTSIRVTDSVGQTSDQAVTVTIASSNIVSQFSLPNAAVGVPYSFTLTAFPPEPSVRTNNGVPNRINAWSAAGLPPGLHVTFSGQISGTPTVAGNYSATFFRRTRTWTDVNKDFIPDCDLTVVGRNGECGASPAAALPMRESLIVDPFEITTSGTLPRGIVGTPYPALALAAQGCGNHAGFTIASMWGWLFHRRRGCTWTAQSELPEGLSLTERGVFRGTPARAFNGIVSIQVAHPVSGAVQKVFALAIASNAPSPLAITDSGSPGPTPLGAGVAVLLSASGGTPPYMWSVVPGGTPPPGITLQGPGQPLGCVVVAQRTGLCTEEIPALVSSDTLGALTGPGLTYLAGRTMAAGKYDFAVAVMDAAGNMATALVTWLVTLP